jgi:undecaprenol kinase
MRFLKSFKYALQGIKHCFVSEKNFRMLLVIAAITFFLGIVFRISASEWLAVLFCSALVLSLEMINTAIEKLSNIVTESIHPVIKQVKDIAAGAVCLVSILSFIIGCIIFLPKIALVIKYFIK